MIGWDAPFLGGCNHLSFRGWPDVSLLHAAPPRAQRIWLPFGRATHSELVWPVARKNLLQQNFKRMEEGKNIRCKWVNVRLTEAEFAEISRQFALTTERKLSDFARRKLLGRPVKILTRDASLDGLTDQLAKLRTELSRLAANYNQAVKKLNSLARIKEFEQWLLTYELDRRKLLAQVEKTGVWIAEIAQRWSP